MLRGVSMISIHLIGHDFAYEVRDLTKVFFLNEEFIFIDDVDEFDEGILIISRLNNRGEKLESIIEIYEDNQLVYFDTLDINTIDIGRDDIYKRIKVGITTNLYNGLNI